MLLRHGSHLANLCQNLFTLQWKSVITGLCLVQPQVFPFSKNFANRQNIKDAIVLGWGRQIFEKSSQTIEITAATVNACQRNMKNDTCGKFNSSSQSIIMNGVGYFLAQCSHMNSHDPGDRVLMQEFFSDVDFFLSSWPLLKLSNICLPIVRSTRKDNIKLL